MARQLAGDEVWPQWPALRYQLSCDGLTGAPAGTPTEEIRLQPHNQAAASTPIEWRSQVYVVDGQEIQFGLIVWADGFFLMPFQIHQIWFNGVAQYEMVPDDFQNNAHWEFILSIAGFQTPTAGASVEFSNVVQSDAVHYADE